MLKNGQAYFKNIAMWTLQNFYSMFGHFFNILHERVKIDHHYLMFST